MRRALRPWLAVMLLLGGVAWLGVGSRDVAAQFGGLRGADTEVRCVASDQALPPPVVGCETDDFGTSAQRRTVPMRLQCPNEICMAIGGGHGEPYTTNVFLDTSATRRHRRPHQATVCCYRAPVPAGSPLG